MSDPATAGNPTDHPVLDEIRLRWSPVCFDGQPVAADTLRSLLEAARWAASCFNDQPWHFVAASRDDPPAFEALLACLVDANREWAQHAGALVLVVARQQFRHNGKANAWSWFDCGQATAHLMLESVHQGLRAHAMAGFDAAAARSAFDLPDEMDPSCFVAIGQVGQHPDHSESLRERDAAENQRLPLTDLVSRATLGDVNPVVDPSIAK